MEIDRNALLAIRGATSESMSPEERAEAIEKFMIAQLGKHPAPAQAPVPCSAGRVRGGSPRSCCRLRRCRSGPRWPTSSCSASHPEP